jgi:hypothetical protein
MCMTLLIMVQTSLSISQIPTIPIGWASSGKTALLHSNVADLALALTQTYTISSKKLSKQLASYAKNTMIFFDRHLYSWFALPTYTSLMCQAIFLTLYSSF